MVEKRKHYLFICKLDKQTNLVKDTFHLVTKKGDTVVRN